MNKGLLYIALLMIALLASCHQEQDDYFTEARLTLLMPDNITVEQIQGTMTLQSLNTTLSQSTADMEGTGFRMQVLRGAYKVDVEGMIQYTDQDGQSRVSHYRAHADYVPFADTPISTAELSITLLQE
ncbi:MAG: hypothetical protein IJV17_05335 [Prevotella sp.]|nr:hypothetical protein [Prevotella sp.]